MNKLDKQYQQLLSDIIEFGVDKKDRTGTGTKSIFGYTIRHNMKDGFPLLTTKKMAFRTMVTELLWFLKGDTNIKYLVDNGCNIWNGDAYKNYERRWETEGKFLSPPVNKFTKEELINEIKTNPMVAKELGELGPIYGKQWRSWGGNDQIKNLIDGLKNNPDSRRLMVNAWNVGELDQMTLPPCHYGFQVYTRKLTIDDRWELLKNKIGEEAFNSLVEDIMPFGGGLSEQLQSHNIPKRAISLMWNQRSVDTFLGLPFNIASYGTLLLLLCDETGLQPGELIGNLGDVHLYKNHIEQAKEQISREGAESLPDLVLNNVDILNGEFDYMVMGYESHPPIFAPLSN